MSEDELKEAIKAHLHSRTDDPHLMSLLRPLKGKASVMEQVIHLVRMWRFTLLGDEEGKQFFQANPELESLAREWASELLPEEA